MAAIGLLCVAGAGLLSNSTFERLLGRPAELLAWGPTLFRILLAFHGLVMVGISQLPAPLRPLRIDPIPRRAWIALAVMSGVALGLRLWALDTCLWLDEILTLKDVARLPLGHVLTSFPSKNQHMLYSILGKLSIMAFGESAWAVRLPSVLLGVASIWALFLLGRRVLNINLALAASAIMTVSYHHVWFSQNARGWMGLLLFSIFATWLWLEAIGQADWRWWLAYTVAIFCGIWLQMGMVIIAATHALIYMVWAAKERRWDWRPFAAWILGATLVVHGHALALPEFFRIGMHEASLPGGTDWTNPLWAIAEALRGMRVGFSGFTVVAGGAAVALAGSAAMLRRNVYSGMAMLLPGPICAAILLALGHNIWPRYFFFCMGFGLLTVMQGAAALPRMLRMPYRLAGMAPMAATALLVVASVVTLPRGYALPKQDFTGARDYLTPAHAVGAPVAAIGLAGHAYKYYAPEWHFPQTPAELESLYRKHPDLALVYTLPIQLQALHPDLWKMASQEFEPVKIFPGTLHDGEVYVCRAHAAMPHR